MGDKIKLTKKQLYFLMEMTEIKEPQGAVDKFIELMVEEQVDPIHILAVIDKIVERMYNSSKK